MKETNIKEVTDGVVSTQRITDYLDVDVFSPPLLLSKDAEDSEYLRLREQIYDILWNGIIHISSFDTLTVSGGTTSNSFNFDIREPDSSERKQFSPSVSSKFRTFFYLDKGQEQIEAYILSPALLNSFTPPTSVDELVSYTGIYIKEGIVYLVSYNEEDGQTLNQTDLVITDNTTYVLEIHYGVNYHEVFINGKSYGTISCDFSKNANSFKTFYPIIAPFRSLDGSTSVQLTLESYQFIQRRV